MKELFEKFQSLFQGQPVEVSDPTNPFQCMDLAYAYCDYLGIPRSTIKHLHAYQVFTSPNADTTKYFDILPVGNTPQEGDLVIWGTDVGVSGHIAGFKERIGNGFISFGQNWKGIQKAVLCTHNSFNGVIGYLRPKKISNTIIEMITDQTKIPQIVDKSGNAMEVQAIRSVLIDQTNYIRQLQEQLANTNPIDSDFLVKAEAVRKALDEFLA